MTHSGITVIVVDETRHWDESAPCHGKVLEGCEVVTNFRGNTVTSSFQVELILEKTRAKHTFLSLPLSSDHNMVHIAPHLIVPLLLISTRGHLT